MNLSKCDALSDFYDFKIYCKIQHFEQFFPIRITGGKR